MKKNQGSSMYYQVRGQRALFVTHEADDGSEKRVRTGVTAEPVLRLECLSLAEAQNYATDIYKREAILCTIDEITRP